MREEKDFLGKLQIPENALYGIHAVRSAGNFPGREAFHPSWYRAMGLVKQAVYRCIKSFKRAADGKFSEDKIPAGMERMEVFDHLEESAAEMASGKYVDHFIVPAIQGGAGTSINMNVNEILTNASLIRMGRSPGDYEVIDPYRHANLFQSTNDVVPTALKLAVMQQLQLLEEGINSLRARVEKLEGQYRDSMRMAYTQMQQALPSSYGMLFSAYNEALARDWWRISKCFERIKVVNLGGGATGSGLAVPRYYVMEVVHQLQQLTNLPVTRSDNHSDTTQNLDALVEVHGILKAHAVNLEKISSDLRLMASDLTGKPEISIPKRQPGSSMMPGKVNPVIPEYVISIAHKVYGNDQLVTSLCGQGCLDLNAYVPLIGHAMLDSLEMLKYAGDCMGSLLFDHLEVHRSLSLDKVLCSPSITTALLPYLGYRHAEQLAAHMQNNSCNIREANKALGLIDVHHLDALIAPESLLRLGYSLKDKM